MIVSIGSDHRGFKLKNQLIKYFKDNNFIFIDHGTVSKSPVDYADYALAVSEDVVKNKASFGVLICHSGIGVCMSSNKIKGIRAALIYNCDVARLCKEHNNANIICFGSKYNDFYLTKKFIKIYLNTKFDKKNHEKRIIKLDNLSSLK